MELLGSKHSLQDRNITLTEVLEVQHDLSGELDTDVPSSLVFPFLEACPIESLLVQDFCVANLTSLLLAKPHNF